MTNAPTARAKQPAAEELPGYGVVHPRSLSVSVSKGGSGKTSLTANIGSIAAARGYRTLLVDLDPQGGLSRDLGIIDTPKDDQGTALAQTLMFSGPQHPQALEPTEVKPNLDLLVGGEKLELLSSWRTDDPNTAVTALQRALVPLHDRYDLILFDHPPVLRQLRELGLAASRFLIIPTRPDLGSIDGVTGVARDFARVKEPNPHLRLLGVVLFGVGAASKALRAEVRSHISEGLGTVAPVFSTIVRYAEAPATQSRNRGMAVHEYADELSKSTSFTESRKGVSAAKLAADYAALTAEILTTVEERLDAEEGQEVGA